MAVDSDVAGGGSIHLTTRRPSPPGDASFLIQIDFQKGTDNPQRVFQAADAMIRAFQNLDKTLCASVDSNIEPIMILEDIEAGSIKVWLGNQLKKVDDEGLKTLDWKPLVGKYLVRAKYVFIEWSNKDKPGLDLLSLAKDLRNIALETDIKHIPDYSVPSIQDLARSGKEIDDAKDFLLPGDKISYSAPGHETVDFNLAVRFSPEELLDIAVKDVVKFERMPMLLVIKKPDYLGKSRWDFRHGKKLISAKIEDTAWLLEFQSRKVDVRPGDALSCLVTIENKYGFDNELISEDHTITKVEGVKENQLVQGNLDLRK
jgi:hypothetical protein